MPTGRGVSTLGRSKCMLSAGCSLDDFLGRPLVWSDFLCSLLGHRFRLTLAHHERGWDRPYVPPLATAP